MDKSAGYHTSRYILFPHSCIRDCCFVEHAKIKNYSDYHDVDEELTIIPAQGGRWAEAGGAGIAFRAVNYTPTTTLNSVASRLIYLS